VKNIVLGTLFAFLVAFSARAQGPLTTISTQQAEKTISWTIELASDDASRTKGLMFVKEMQPRHGMLFRFEQNRPVSMWMKNTFIALDMVFMNEQGTVTHIHRGAVPHSEDIISSNGPARYVLEINAGEASQSGLKAGQVFSHPWFQASK